MSIEQILADTGIDYTVKDGVCHIKVKRCRNRINKSDNPERDIMSYLNKTQGCGISALCRHTGCTRYRVTQIVNHLCDAGRVYKAQTRQGTKSIIIYPN